MIWLTWRQFRAQALTAVAVLAAAALYFLVTGLQMHHTYTADLASCAAPNAQNSCDEMLGRFQNSYSSAYQLAQLLVIAAPALIGIFWGAPLIGRELETGTHQVAWNQSVTRTRWLAVKLALVGTASIVTAGLLSYLLTWWAGPLDEINGSRFASMTFSSRDIVPLAYAAFAFASGTTAGLLIRRTVPAMAVTLAVFIGIQILVPGVIRPNLLPSTTATIAVNQVTMNQADGIEFDGPSAGGTMYIHGLPVAKGAWIMSSSAVENSAGQPVSSNAYASCFHTDGTGELKASFSQIGACLAGDDLHTAITYQPAGNYWPLQWYESGIFLALGGGLSGFCFWWIRRRQS